jgi:hypothetical protein
MVILRSMDRCRLPLQRSINATFDQLLTRARYGVDTGIRRPGNAVIAPALARIRGVGLQQDARAGALPFWISALRYSRSSPVHRRSVGQYTSSPQVVSRSRCISPNQHTINSKGNR